MLKGDKGDQVQTLGIVISHRLLQDLKGISVSQCRHAVLCSVATYDDGLFEGGLPGGRLIFVSRTDDADRFDHVWVSRRKTQSSDAASSISQDVGGRNA
jgi:hypothetical protein